MSNRTVFITLIIDYRSPDGKHAVTYVIVEIFAEVSVKKDLACV